MYIIAESGVEDNQLRGGVRTRKNTRGVLEQNIWGCVADRACGIVLFKKYASRARTEYYMGIVPFSNVVYRIKYILYMGVVVVDSSNKTVPLLSKTYNAPTPLLNQHSYTQLYYITIRYAHTTRITILITLSQRAKRA